MKKILQVVSSFGIGGGEKIVFEIINGLKVSFDFVMTGPDTKGEYGDIYRKENIKMRWLGNKKSSFKTVFRLREIIQDEKPDFIHCHGTRAAVWSRLASIGIKNRPKIFYSLHGFHIIRHPFLIRTLLIIFERILNIFTDKLIVVSDSDASLVKKFHAINPKKIALIKNGIDLDLYSSASQLPKSGKFVLFSAARLHPPKDFLTVLKAISILIKKGLNLELQIAGDGPLRQSIEDKITELKLERDVILLGFQTNVIPYLNMADVVVLSSAWEGLPLLVLEAGAAGKPIIASNVDGIREAARDGITGSLFKFGNAEDLAEKISLLYQDRGLCKRLGEGGRQNVQDNFSAEAMIKKYRELYMG